MSAEKPKPCRHCGKSAVLVEVDDEHAATCSNKTCLATAYPEWHPSRAEAIRRWNTRHGESR